MSDDPRRWSNRDERGGCLHCEPADPTHRLIDCDCPCHQHDDEEEDEDVDARMDP